MSKLAVLTLDQRAQFDRDGYLVIPRLLANPVLDHVLAWTVALAAMPDVPGRQMKYYEDSLTALVALDPATVDNGRLELAAGHHRRGLLGPLWQSLSDAELQGVEFAPFPTAPGDVILFDSIVPHCSAPNLIDRPRRLLYITYNRKSAGDQRERYFADKRKSFPPDCEREPGKSYAYKV
ncbi:MAG: hypothetical protein EXQ88_00885 [Alphaproteobacteria bacterium]|nr:hypothetical protein [Alphaproteobacteria bacterium]